MTTVEYRTTFNAAHSDFAKIAPRVWNVAGHALVFALELRAGEVVLDVCAGAGSSALAAARAVGPTGRVHAIDLADDLLEEGRLVASEWALQNIDFVAADATKWEPPSTVPAAGYDVLASSYGVFFLPHMDSSFARLTRLLRPGGRIGVTVWREHALDDFTRPFFEALGKVAPQAVPGKPAVAEGAAETARDAADRINTVDKLSAWLTSLGTTDVRVTELSNYLPATDEFAWEFVLGSGLRAPLAELDDDTVRAVREQFIELLTDRGVHTVDAGTIVGTAVVDRRTT